MPGADFLDARALVNWHRAVKSAEELAFMRKAARMSERLVDLAHERIEPGLPKNLLVGEIMAAAFHGDGADWGDYAAIVPLPSGTDAAAPHLKWDGRPLERDTATFFELSGCFRRSGFAMMAPPNASVTGPARSL